jgi:hypothetical protein
MMVQRDVVSVEPVGDYRIDVVFSDGTAGTVDLEARLWGPMFEPLRDPSLFAAVRLDESAGTIVWPNGADLAPETLYDEVIRSTTTP